ASRATGEACAWGAGAGPADVADAVAAAGAAGPAWAALSAFERAACCRAVAAAIEGRAGDLARALAEDQGKPLEAEARDEVSELAEYFRMAAEDAIRLAGGAPPSTSASRRVLTLRVPLGVVGVITRWNWPYTRGADLFAPAMAAGNTVVWVPAPTTSACCALLAEIITGAGVPAGVFSFLPGPGPVVGDAVAGHPGVRAVGFIGSGATRAGVAGPAAGTAQPLGPGRQRAQGEPRRRRPRPGHRGGVGGRVPVRGPELYRRRALPGARRGAGRVRGPGGGGHQGPHQAGGPVRPGNHDGAAEQRADGGQVRPARGRRAGRRGPGVLRRRARGGVPHRAVRRADRAGRGHAGDGDRPRGDVWAGAAGHRGRLRGAGAGTDQRLPLRAHRRRVHRGPGARPGLCRAGAGRLGEHQRLDQPLGVAPAVRRAVRLGERARPGRRALCHGDLHRVEDDRLPRSPIRHVNSRQSQPRPPGTDGAGYLDMRVGEFLDALAAARPDPGGGS